MIAKFKTQHWVAIGLTLTLSVLLYIAPKKGEDKPEEKSNKPMMSEFNIKGYYDSAYSSLDPKIQALILAQENVIKQTSNVTFKVNAYDSIAAIWKAYKNPFLMAYAKYSKANDIKLTTVYASAGNDCYISSRFVAPSQQHFLLDKAIECYSAALKSDSKNLDYKASLGICFVENGLEPMTGIGYLREVVAKDSTNLKAQTSLGMFAIQSGQNDKAVNRFSTIVRMYPENAEAYLFLAQAYTNLNEKQKAIENLKIFKGKNTDKTIDSEIDSYIRSLTTK